MEEAYLADGVGRLKRKPLPSRNSETTRVRGPRLHVTQSRCEAHDAARSERARIEFLLRFRSFDGPLQAMLGFYGYRA